MCSVTEAVDIRTVAHVIPEGMIMFTIRVGSRELTLSALGLPVWILINLQGITLWKVVR
jgi:hypothetical protein